MPLRLSLVMLLVACGGGEGPVGRVVDNDEEIDEVGPEIEHTNDPSARVFEEPVILGATVSDDSAIDQVAIVFQRETDGGRWTSLLMAPFTEDIVDDRNVSYYEGTIPGDEVTSGGVRYYLKAIDEWGNEACLPDDCASEAWHFPVVPPR